MTNNKVYFVSAGPGDPELITVKGMNLLKKADVVLYTGSLVPESVLGWVKDDCIVRSSQGMKYDEIFSFIKDNVNKGIFVRLHTGDVSIYSTLAKQIHFLRSIGVDYEVVPGVTSALGAAASMGIEYTIPGVSQTLILSRVEGQTPNPEPLINILNCKKSSLVFYLSVTLIHKLVTVAINEAGYDKNTPCSIIEKATWDEERIITGTLGNIEEKLSNTEIKGLALVLVGDYLNQEETEESHLYNK